MDRNMKPKSPHKLSNIIQFNPTERLAKGTLAKKVPMEYLQPFTRAISDYETAKYSGGSKFRNGDTLMARITPCLENGKTAYVSILDDGEVGFGSTEYIVFRNIEGVTDSKFVYYFVTSPWFREIAIKSMVGSSGRQRVQQSVLENLEVTLPPLDEQRRIAGILGSLDDKIELNRRINANLEAQAQALFRSWFVDFEPFRDGPFVDSELGKIPQGWKTISLSELMNYAGGSQPPASEFINSYKDGYVRFIQIRDYASESHITYIPISSKNKTCDIRDIMIARYGASLGRICYGLKGAYNVALAKVLPVKPYYREFLRSYLSSDYFYQSINMKGNRAVQAGFNQSDINSFRLNFPKDESIIQTYDKVCSQFLNKRLQVLDEIKALSALRDTLLPKLMDGEIAIE